MNNNAASFAQTDLDYACRALAKKLGLDRPVPVSLFLRAANEPEFRDRLFAHAHDLPGLEPLLAMAGKDGEPADHGARQPSTSQLVGAALKAFWSWAGTGFGIVPGDIYRRRISACRACPFYGQRSHSTAYAIASLWADDTRVCSLCGCVMSAKARLPKQSCPSRDPEDPARSRWGEPYE